MQLGKPLKERKTSSKQAIIGKFVEIPKGDRYFWPREMKICTKLVQAYGEDFLLWVTPPNFKAKSLTVYMGEWGKKFLSEQLYEFKKNIKPHEDTLVKTEAPEGEKVGEDIILEQKPRTLQDFLKLHRTKA